MLSDQPMTGKPGRHPYKNVSQNETTVFRNEENSFCILNSLVLTNKLTANAVNVTVNYSSTYGGNEETHPCWLGAGGGGFEQDCYYSIDQAYLDDEMMNAAIGDNVTSEGGYLVAVVNDNYVLTSENTQHLTDTDAGTAQSTFDSLTHGSQSDWSLPNLSQLQAIYDNWNNGELPTGLLTNTKYWSNETEDAQAEYFDFSNGSPNTYSDLDANTADAYAVRHVAEGDLSGVAVGDEVNGEGGYIGALISGQYVIVIYNSEHLQNEKPLDAQSTINNLTYSGFSDWHLPTSQETQTIYGNWDDGTLPSALFSAVEYWTNNIVEEQFIYHDFDTNSTGTSESVADAFPIRTVAVVEPTLEMTKIRRWGPYTIPPGESAEIISSHREALAPEDAISVISDHDDSVDVWVSYMV